MAGFGGHILGVFPLESSNLGKNQVKKKNRDPQITQMTAD